MAVVVVPSEWMAENCPLSAQFFSPSLTPNLMSLMTSLGTGESLQEEKKFVFEQNGLSRFVKLIGRRCSVLWTMDEVRSIFSITVQEERNILRHYFFLSFLRRRRRNRSRETINFLIFFWNRNRRISDSLFRWSSVDDDRLSRSGVFFRVTEARYENHEGGKFLKFLPFVRSKAQFLKKRCQLIRWKKEKVLFLFFPYFSGLDACVT